MLSILYSVYSYLRDAAGGLENGIIKPCIYNGSLNTKEESRNTYFLL